jgi:trigger factor
VNSTVETLEDNKVKLSVEVDESEIDEAISDAFKKIASEVKLPGFRPGKAPRKVLEARLGKDYARGQALQDALPGYYSEAVREHEVDVIAQPEIDITSGEANGPVIFDAVVEIRPEINVAGYDGLRVEIPSPEVTDEELDGQIDQLRSQFGELETVDRPAIDDDHVTIDVVGSHDGEDVEGLTVDDWVYQLGSGAVVVEIDENLRGAKVGDILEFDSDHPDPDTEGQLNFRILVKEVQQNKLPELDDAFIADATEFETVDEYRSDIESRVGNMKKAQSSMALQEAIATALGELVDAEIPDALIDGEVGTRLQDLMGRLQAQGADLEQYLAATGRSQESLIGDMRESAATAVKVDLALRAVAVAEELEPTSDDLDEELERMAPQFETDAAELREQLDSMDRLFALRSDLRKRLALEWLVERVEVVDPDGQAIDRADLELPSDDDGSEDPSTEQEEDEE